MSDAERNERAAERERRRERFEEEQQQRVAERRRLEENRQQQEIERRRLEEEERQQQERDNPQQMADEGHQRERDEPIDENCREREDVERVAEHFQERFYSPPNIAQDDRSWERMIGHMIQENQIRSNQIDRRDKTIDTLIEQIQNMTRIIPNASSTPRVDENPTFNYNVMPDLIKNIEQFDGEGDSMAAQSWINVIENMRQLHHWSDGYVLDAARMSLVGGARRWFRTRAAEISTWSDFQSSFKRTFLVQENLTSQWQRMVNRIQQRNETVTTYFHDKYDLCHNLKLSFDESKELILTGLWSRDTANALLGCRHLDADDLLHGILKQEKMSYLRGERIGSSMSRTQQPTEVKRKDDFRRENTNFVRPKEIVCHNCGVGGHLLRNCPEPKQEPTCYRCKKKGHISRQCQEVPNRRDVNQVTGCPKNNIQKYLKKVRIDDKIFNSFVDMGSSECIIKMTAALMNGFQFHKGIIELKAFGPSNFKVISPGWIRASLTVDDATADNIIFRVVPDDVQAYDVLIGRTFTELGHVVYQKIGDELTFQEKINFHPFMDIEIEDFTSIKPESPLQAGSVNVLTAVRGSTNVLLPILNMGSEDVPAGEVFNIRHHITPANTKIVSRKIISEDVSVGEEQPPVVVNELIEILNEFRDCVSLDANEIGCHTDLTMEIEEIPGSKPVQSKPYPASELEKEKIRDIVSDWRRLGVVTDTNSAYSSPVLLVRKKTGDSRLVVDYRRLNNQTIKVNFPLPNIDDHVALLAGAKMFIVLDLAQGYLQIPIHPKDRHKTAFITPEETGEFTRMIFGLTNAPFYFTKVMQRVLGPLRNRVVLYYLDDILIPGRDWIDLKERLLLVFESLRKGGLTVQLKKCEFLMQRVNYLGFIISDKGIEPGERKLLAIEEFPKPKNVHEVRRFLGLAGFFRRFVNQFSLRAAPLYELLKAQTAFEWSEETEKAFDDLRSALLCKPILQLFDPKKYTELHTDASSRGLAAMLFQRGEDGKMHLVYAISRLTAEAEKWYHSSKLELLALMWATQRLRFLLINIEFKIITDCQALIFLNIQKTRNPQICRWYNLLCEFNFTIEHRPGTKLLHVDALSRAPTEKCDPENVGELCVFTLASDDDEILIYQSQDDMLQRKIQILKNKTPEEYTSYEKGEVQGFELDNGILYKNINGQMKYVVPRSLRKSLTVRFHDLQGHFGLDRTLGKLQRFYYFPGMRRYVKQHIGACLHCLLAKTRTGRPAGQLHPIPPALKPFMIIHLDHIGPFITSSKGNKYILVLVDNLTKYVRLDAVRNTSAENVVRKLEDFITEFGAPERVVSDRGTCFTSSKFEAFCDKHGIMHTLNSPRHAQANGQVERVNRTLLPTIMATLDENKEGKDWDRKLKMIARDLNSSENKTTGKTPFELLYGYTPRFNEGLIRQMTVREESVNYERPELIREKAIERIKTEQQKFKNRYDRGRLLNVQYNIGDIVYMSSPPQATGDSTKLHPRNRGPLVITRIMPGDTYGVATLRLDTAGRKYASTAHVSQLKLWRPPIEEEEVESELANLNKHTNLSRSDPIPNQDAVNDELAVDNPVEQTNTSTYPPIQHQDNDSTNKKDDGGEFELQHSRPKRQIIPPLRHRDYVI